VCAHLPQCRVVHKLCCNTFGISSWSLFISSMSGIGRRALQDTESIIINFMIIFSSPLCVLSQGLQEIRAAPSPDGIQLTVNHKHLINKSFVERKERNVLPWTHVTKSRWGGLVLRVVARRVQGSWRMHALHTQAGPAGVRHAWCLPVRSVSNAVLLV
jgi:hypothetical protein